MADQIADAVESYDPSASSILNKLPGKRIDAYIRKVSSRGIPEQGETTGGYAEDYAHLSHIPLFPLYSEEQRKILAKKWGETSKWQDWGKQDLDMKTKLTMKGMDMMGGGHLGTVTATKWLVRTIGGLETMAASVAVDQNQLVVITRWIVPARQGTPWLVDVFEHRWLDPNSTRGKMSKVSGNAVLLKPGQPTDTKVTFKVFDNEAKGMKSQKTWSKKRGIEASCDAVILVEGGVDVPLEMVARFQRVCSVFEGREMQKRFEDQWKVPILR
ncbi:uncharacterized protein Z520_05981 [Fonsecaea multimorphosa CBS 102226]|uniref:Uncharacterized protein n=1 Tax=Fonsecaea multimorphosa CBS 102226 TaxID=1442371 RepID=A0A0D2H9W5_9EURO|nr:uncharacterized protein Z520_05981 [Fonsecaea multimorphosa CBS 102226]KIX98680.1 hypothetical protein Z520_05981 [Fonsecaea multimorphosa CBS 102226]OAL24865.1 hypothetical protein AYO22_05654 [Fonsecaea multimorphosa]